MQHKLFHLDYSSFDSINGLPFQQVVIHFFPLCLKRSFLAFSLEAMLSAYYVESGGQVPACLPIPFSFHIASPSDYIVLIPALWNDF